MSDHRNESNWTVGKGRVLERKPTSGVRGRGRARAASIVQSTPKPGLGSSTFSTAQLGEGSSISTTMQSGPSTSMYMQLSSGSNPSMPGLRSSAFSTTELREGLSLSTTEQPGPSSIMQWGSGSNPSMPGLRSSAFSTTELREGLSLSTTVQPGPSSIMQWGSGSNPSTTVASSTSSGIQHDREASYYKWEATCTCTSYLEHSTFGCRKSKKLQFCQNYQNGKCEKVNCLKVHCTTVEKCRYEFHGKLSHSIVVDNAKKNFKKGFCGLYFGGKRCPKMDTCKFDHVRVNTDLLTCPVCLELIEQSVLQVFVKCGHPICKTCITFLKCSMDDEEQVACPTCRLTGGVQNLH